MDFLLNCLDGTQLPFITAFILGLMTAISPCPLATNITAIAFIGKDIDNKHRVFINGILYTLGRAITYTSLGLIFYFGASQFHISTFVQSWGEKLLGPLLIIIGIFMLDFIKITFPSIGGFSKKVEEKAKIVFGVFCY